MPNWVQRISVGLLGHAETCDKMPVWLCAEYDWQPGHGGRCEGSQVDRA